MPLPMAIGKGSSQNGACRLRRTMKVARRPDLHPGEKGATMSQTVSAVSGDRFRLDRVLAAGLGLQQYVSPLRFVEAHPLHEFVHRMPTDNVVGSQIALAYLGNTMQVKFFGLYTHGFVGMTDEQQTKAKSGLPKGQGAPQLPAVAPGAAVRLEGIEVKPYQLDGQREVCMSVRATDLEVVDGDAPLLAEPGLYDLPVLATLTLKSAVAECAPVLQEVTPWADMTRRGTRFPTIRVVRRRCCSSTAAPRS